MAGRLLSSYGLLMMECGVVELLHGTSVSPKFGSCPSSVLSGFQRQSTSSEARDLSRQSPMIALPLLHCIE